MPRRVRIHYVSLKSCLVNLPISMYGPLVGNGVRPQALAVHLLKPGIDESPMKEGYVGWTGMASSSSLAQLQSQTTSRSSGDRAGALETVEIDPQFAAALGFAQGDVVEIGLLHDLPVARSVATEPLSADDWEILELHAGYVEDNLLAQVRAACVDQEIDVWVMGRTRIRFRVVSSDPATTPSKKAVLLGTDTEVSIAPKLRGSTASSAEPPAASADKKTVGSSVADAASSAVDTTQTPSRRPLALRNLPLRIVDSSSIPPPLTDEPTSTIFVSPTTFAQLLPPSSPPLSRDTMSSTYTVATIRVLPSPTTNDIPTAGSNPGTGLVQGTKERAPLAAAKQLLLDGSRKQEEESEDEEPERVLIRPLLGVPERHAVVWLILPVSRAGEWDLISVFDAEAPEIHGPATASDDGSPHRLRLVAPSGATDLAGVDSVLESLSSFLVRSFALLGQPAGAPNLPVPTVGVPALLLCGSAGSGRTSVAKEVVERMRRDPRVLAHNLYVDMSKYSEERPAVLKALFERWIDMSSWFKPSVLVLDNLDRVIGPEVEHADSSRQRQLAEHFIAAFSPTRNIRGLVLLATVQNPTTLHPLLSSTHIFNDRVTLKAPDKNARRAILARLVEKQMMSSDLEQDAARPLNHVALATQTEGYSATDLRDLVGRAVHQAAIRSMTAGRGVNASPIQLLSEDFTAAQVDFTPLSLRDVKLQKSEVEWKDIGGLHETRRVLRETLEWPTKYSAIFARCPIRLRSGLLLYGYPGCGKTLLASAVAKECGLNFISVKGPELLNKYIGASEKSVRDLFERATAAKPCVLFFDEFDSIAPKRGHDSTGVTDRVVNQMLTQMDGAEGLDGVYVLAATSRPDLIDSALLRPGRLDKSLLCNMPDLDERAEILSALRHKVALSDTIDLQEFARLTDGFSGADLQALVYNAHLDAVHASITEVEQEKAALANGSKEPSKADVTATPTYIAFGGQTGSGGVLSRAEQSVQERRVETIVDTIRQRSSATTQSRPQGTARPKPVVLEAHLRSSLASTKPSVSPEERHRLSKIYAAFVSDRDGNMQVPPDMSGIGNRASLG